MKRFARFLIVIPAFYFILKVNKQVTQFGPFTDQTSCDQTAALFTTPSDINHGYNPFFVKYAVTSACWD